MSLFCQLCGTDGPLERNGNHASCNRLNRKKITDEEKENNKRERAEEMARERARRYAEKARANSKRDLSGSSEDGSDSRISNGSSHKDSKPNGGKKQSYIKPRSAKRAAEEREYLKRRDKYLTLHPECERCSLPANQIHHKKGKIGKLLINVMYFMAVCPDCHHWIENNPLKAKEEGYSVNRLTPE